jgi:hypothetical protein
MTRFPGEAPDEGVLVRGARERVARSCVARKEQPTEDLHNSRGDRDEYEWEARNLWVRIDMEQMIREGVYIRRKE